MMDNDKLKKYLPVFVQSLFCAFGLILVSIFHIGYLRKDAIGVSLPYLFSVAITSFVVISMIYSRKNIERNITFLLKILSIFFILCAANYFFSLVILASLVRITSTTIATVQYSYIKKPQDKSCTNLESWDPYVNSAIQVCSNRVIGNTAQSGNISFTLARGYLGEYVINAKAIN